MPAPYGKVSLGKEKMLVRLKLVAISMTVNNKLQTIQLQHPIRGL